MKKTTFFLLLTTLMFSGLRAQTYSTGTVTLFSNYSAKIDLSADLGVRVTLIGPSTSWLGIAFDAVDMNDMGKDVIIFNGTAVTDRTFVGEGIVPPTDAQQDWSVVSNDVASGVRTVVLSRALNTGDANDHVFTLSNAPINLAFARRTGSTAIGYHGAGNCGSTIANFTLGTEDFKLDSFKMFPNPASNYTTVMLPDNVSKGTVKIYDALGRVVRKEEITTEKNTIDTSALTAGTYMVVLRTDYGNATKTLLVQ